MSPSILRGNSTLWECQLNIKWIMPATLVCCNCLNRDCNVIILPDWGDYDVAITANYSEPEPTGE